MQLSPVEWVVILTSLTSGTLGVLGLGSYLYFRARAQAEAHRRRQQQHLARLQRLTAKLLNACDQLLSGGSPEETVLYHRFQANGGEYYPDIQTDVYETLSGSQPALAAAFELHQQLIDPAAQQTRSLEQQIRDWEILYASLVGQSEQIQDMVGDELRVLLDPMASEGSETSPAELVEQLEALQRDLADKPLKVRWHQISSGEVQPEGLLGAIHRIKNQLAYLPDRHKQEAPYWLAEARSQRHAAEAEIPSFWEPLYQYVMSQPNHDDGLSRIQAEAPLDLLGPRFFTKIDARLAQAEAAQTMGRFFEVIEHAYAIWQDMDILKAFFKAMKDHGRRQAQVDVLTGQDYRPPGLAETLQEIKVDVQTITEQILAGRYTNAAPWIEELNLDSQRLLTEIKAWQIRHEQNFAELAHLREWVDRTAGWWQDEVQPAWERLRTYIPATWSDLTGPVEQSQHLFNRIRTEQIDEIESLNSLTVQKLTGAEQLLAYVTADMVQIEQQFQAILNRLARVEAAESHLPEALDLTEADLARAKRLRDQEDIKIGPEVDHQIDQAQEHLAQATRLAAEGQFLTAVEEQATARQLATAAYVTADQEVREINTRQKRLETAMTQGQKKVAHCQTEIEQLAVVVETMSTRRLAQALQEKEAEAEQARLAATGLEDRALAQALETAIEAYKRLGQQADWVTHQVAADQAEYDRLLSHTLATIAEARAAIQQAKQAVTELDTSGAGQRALYRAEQALPSADDSKQATRAALQRMQQQAEAVILYARQGEQLVQRKRRLSPLPLPPDPEPGREIRLRRLSKSKSVER